MEKGHFGEPRILADSEIEALLNACAGTRYPHRNRAIVLLACDAGLTPMEIAHLRRWNVLTDRGVLGDHIDLLGKPGRYLTPRRIPIAIKGRLWWAILDVLKNAPATPKDPLIVSERALEGGHATRDPGASPLEPMRPTSIGYVFWKLCDKAKIRVEGGRTARRTFLVRAARSLRQVHGATIRDVQAITGQRSLDSLQALLEADNEAEKHIVGDLFEPLRR